MIDAMTIASASSHFLAALRSLRRLTLIVFCVKDFPVEFLSEMEAIRANMCRQSQCEYNKSVSVATTATERGIREPEQARNAMSKATTNLTNTSLIL